MSMRDVAIGVAAAAWVSLGVLIGYQSSQEIPPEFWGLVQRFALASIAIAATMMASTYTTTS